MAEIPRFYPGLFFKRTSLLLQGCKRVANLLYTVRAQKNVIFGSQYKVGYIPQHYATEREWDSRLVIERSRAIKAPWIGFHLAGTKKVQQIVAGVGMVEKYIEDESAVARIRSTFMAMYGLEENDVGRASMEIALRDPACYVLKPQLEGGGNNIYGADVATTLQKLSWSERAAYILMQRIRPVSHGAYLVRAKPPACCSSMVGCCMALDGQAKVVDCVSELGIYGYLIGDAKSDNKIVHNVTGGYLLRTKCCCDDEGGVMAGASVLNTPFLV